MHTIGVLWLSLSVLCVCNAITSYIAPPCYSDLTHCRDELGEKAILALKDKYILMIGDSLTRYQYLSLVYTLRHRRAPAITMFPNLNENTHGEWIRFFETTNHMLAPYEDCDCSYYGGRFFEHRRYHDVHTNVSVTYLMYRGFFIEGTNDTNSLFAPEPKAETAPKWSVGMEKYLTTMFTPKKVDVVVVNVGFFGFHESILPEKFITWCQQLSPNVIWKTTTYTQDEAKTRNSERDRMDVVDKKMCETPSIHCMDTSWTIKADAKLDYWNSNHFNEPIYSILNDQMIDMIKTITARA